MQELAAYPKEPWANPPLADANSLLNKIDFAHQVLVVIEFPTLCTRLRLRAVVVTGDKARFEFEPQEPGPYACFATSAVRETHALAVEARTMNGVNVVEGTRVTNPDLQTIPGGV